MFPAILLMLAKNQTMRTKAGIKKGFNQWKG